MLNAAKTQFLQMWQPMWCAGNEVMKSLAPPSLNPSPSEATEWLRNTLQPSLAAYGGRAQQFAQDIQLADWPDQVLPGVDELAGNLRSQGQLASTHAAVLPGIIQTMQGSSDLIVSAVLAATALKNSDLTGKMDEMEVIVTRLMRKLGIDPNGADQMPACQSG